MILQSLRYFFIVQGAALPVFALTAWAISERRRQRGVRATGLAGMRLLIAVALLSIAVGATSPWGGWLNALSAALPVGSALVLTLLGAQETAWAVQLDRRAEQTRAESVELPRAGWPGFVRYTYLGGRRGTCPSTRHNRLSETISYLPENPAVHRFGKYWSRWRRG